MRRWIRFQRDPVQELTRLRLTVGSADDPTSGASPRTALSATTAGQKRAESEYPVSETAEPVAHADLAVVTAGSAFLLKIDDESGFWLDFETVSELREHTDEKIILEKISTLFPGAEPEEALFRYYLSRAVLYKEYTLPALPASVHKILVLSRRFHATLSDYTKVVESDPGLAKGVFRLANSAAFATASEMHTLPQAVAHVGVKEVEKIAMAQALGNRMFQVRQYEPLVRDLTRHSVATAIGAEQMARYCQVDPKDAFLAGLFHDCGKLVLLGLIADVQKRRKHAVPDGLIDSAFRAFHLSIGENACQSWHFPDEVTASVALHHKPIPTGDTLADSVGLGNVLAHLAETKEAEFVLAPEDPFKVRLQMTPDQLAGVVGEVRLKWKDYYPDS